MIYWLYAHLLKRQITELPGQVCFMIDAKDMADAPENLYRVTSWCNDISAYVAKHAPSTSSGIRGLTFHIATPSLENPMPFYRPSGRSAPLQGSTSIMGTRRGDRDRHGCGGGCRQERERGDNRMYPEDGK